LKMKSSADQKKLVITLKDRCRVCYTCVRECPAKAIKIINGQAEILIERCIGCGNCTKVCSQGAKVYQRSGNEVEALLEAPGKVAAIVAPSFPAEFIEFEDYRILVGMIKSLGFDYVFEVGFGADLVAAKYQEILESEGVKRYISSDCPAIVNYVEHYHPELVSSLAGIVSPMVAMTRAVRKKHGDNLKVVFIGPCVAKKQESDEVTEILTFAELRELFRKRDIHPRNTELVAFDPPYAGKGSIFPISRGLLQTIDIKESAFEGNIIVAEGRADFQEALKEFEAGLINTQHLELLCCEGCIMGPGMTPGGKQFARRTNVSNYVRDKILSMESGVLEKQLAVFSDLDLTTEFEAKDRRLPKPMGEAINEILKKMGKMDPKDFLNCGACGYDTCEDHAQAVIEGLAEIEMCLPLTIEKLHNSVHDLAITNEKLVAVQQALKQSEKMASMGQLSAGIAHELNNPLGVVIMYCNILLDETPKDSSEYNDLKLIVDQANRCKKIVGGLLNFARKNQVLLTEVNMNAVLKQSLDALIIPVGINVDIDSSEVQNPIVQIDMEQMIQVLTNLIKNSIEAMPNGGTLKLKLKENINHITFIVSDTGTGIREEDQEKIFEPFFTTKGVGKGTGLGLATAYGIVKMHKGQISLTSNTDINKGPTGTTFTITIPRDI
jgi:iron only hydrogenase large subunit-like protein/nitrogen-specific signal transduction histidine kinase